MSLSAGKVDVIIYVISEAQRREGKEKRQDSKNILALTVRTLV